MITRIAPFNLILILWLIGGLSCIYLIPVSPGDDLHYLGIAWNMFKAHSWLLTYSMADIHHVDLEKTPLLYWFILAGWHVFGVNDTWPKVLIFLLGTANICLTTVLARQIFPENNRIAWLSAAVLLCNFLWPHYFGAAIRFEGLVTLLGLLFLISLSKYLRDKTVWSLYAAGIAFGLCLFSKGGVGFIYFLPLAILMPYLLNRHWNIRWLFAFSAVIGMALIPSVLYLVYIYFSLGSQSVHILLFGQISSRVGHVYHIADLMMLILFFSPWMIFFRFKKPKFDKRILILMVQIFFTLVFFSFGVLFHFTRYFIPVCPLIALVIAYFVDQFYCRDKPIILLAMLMSGVMIMDGVIEHFGSMAKSYDTLAGLAAEVKSLQLEGNPVALFGPKFWEPTLDFLGRLPKDLPIVRTQKDQMRWLGANPHGYTIEGCEKPIPHSRHCYELKKNSLVISVWSDKPGCAQTPWSCENT